MSAAPEHDRRLGRRLLPLTERAVRVTEVIVIVAATALVIASVILATVTMYGLFIQGVSTDLGSIQSIDALQAAVQRVFGGVLLLMLGLELLETLKSYFTDFRFKIEIILIVSMIAIGRHIMLLDIEHTSGAVLLGSAGLMLALAASYVLVRERRTAGE